MQVKVCGITQPGQLEALSSMEVAYAGFIFYPRSPRFVEKAGLSGADVKKVGTGLQKVGVFVNATYEEVMRRVDEYGLDMVQLHGREMPSECKKLAANRSVIKAFRFTDNDGVESAINAYETSADFFLFDTGIPAPIGEPSSQEKFGGTGHKFDWNLLENIKVEKPFFLSGGIDYTDAKTIKDFMLTPAASNLIAVDINSRFETSPGVKDLEKVARFIKELKSQ